MQFRLVTVPIPYYDHSAGIQVADAFFHHLFLLCPWQVMQHIGQDDGIVPFKSEPHYITVHKINAICFAEAMICRVNLLPVIIYPGDLPLRRGKRKHIRHEPIAAANIKYLPLFRNQVMKGLVVLLQFGLYPHVPFQHGALVQVIIYELLPEVGRLFNFSFKQAEFIPEIPPDRFRPLGISLPKTFIFRLYPGQELYCKLAVF